MLPLQINHLVKRKSEVRGKDDREGEFKGNNEF